jgi:hypothetical protein
LKKKVEYINTEIAANIFGVNKKTVAKYCRTGQIKGCIKGADNKWLIPANAIKPLTTNQIKTVLQSIIYVKNNPKQNTNTILSGDNARGVELTCQYLFDHGYIEAYKKNKNYEVKIAKIRLTDKGMDLAMSGKKKFEGADISVLQGWVNIVIQLAMLYFQAKK